MSNSYNKIFQNLSAAKWELKNRNDPTLNQCIKYIKDAVVELGRLNAQYANLSAEYDMFKLVHSFAGHDDVDDWSDD